MEDRELDAKESASGRKIMQELVTNLSDKHPMYQKDVAFSRETLSCFRAEATKIHKGGA